MSEIERSNIRTRAVTKARRRESHKWSEKEYVLAIYMALYSNEYKVGIYNLDQCARCVDVKPHVFKMMSDNFRAFDGRANLGTNCPKMEKSFKKYKNIPQEELLKVAIKYIDRIWNLSRKKLDVEKYIKSIGQKAFVDYYELFEEATKDSDNIDKYVDKLPQEWNLEGRKIRTTCAVMLFRCKKEKEALSIIEKSKKLYPETIEKARMLLNKKLEDVQ